MIANETSSRYTNILWSSEFISEFHFSFIWNIMGLIRQLNGSSIDMIIRDIKRDGLWRRGIFINGEIILFVIILAEGWESHVLIHLFIYREPLWKSSKNLLSITLFSDYMPLEKALKMLNSITFFIPLSCFERNMKQFGRSEVFLSMSHVPGLGLASGCTRRYQAFTAIKQCTERLYLMHLYLHTPSEGSYNVSQSSEWKNK